MSINVSRVTTSGTLRKPRPILCHSCRQRVPVVTRDGYGNPICPACAGPRADFLVQVVEDEPEGKAPLDYVS